MLKPRSAALIPVLSIYMVPAAFAAGISLEIWPRNGAPPFFPEQRFLYSAPAAPGVGGAAATLDELPGTDVQRRGATGAQADISLRGGSYQQTLLMIDGVRVNDPQTAHHNMDIPLNPSDIDTVSVLPGAHAAGTGADAFGGAVEIRTRRPSADSVKVTAGAGDLSSRTGELSIERRFGAFAQRLSAGRVSGGGPRPGTDHEADTLAAAGRYSADWGNIDYSLGWSEKEFGAAGFYSALTSGEREATRTRSASVSAGVASGGLTVSPRVYWRGHDDRFSYLYNSTAYSNRHRTELTGAGLELRRSVAGGSVFLGTEYYAQSLDSSNMGKRSSGVAGVKGGFSAPLGGPLGLTARLRADRHSSWGWQWSPGLEMRADLGRAMVWAAASRAFRAPSFTELYYSDPGNRGDPGLRPERAYSYELGGEWKAGGSRMTASVFSREERGVIDWTRASAASPWNAGNTGSAYVSGAEASVAARAGDLALSFSGSLMSRADSSRLESKYARRYPRAKCRIGAAFSLPSSVEASLAVAAVRRAGEEGYVLGSAGLARDIGGVRAALDVTNILDTRYEEVPGLAAPGRWFGFTLGYSFV